MFPFLRTEKSFLVLESVCYSVASWQFGKENPSQLAIFCNCLSEELFPTINSFTVKKICPDQGNFLQLKVMDPFLI